MLYTWNICNWASHMAQMVKKPPANSGDIREAGFIPGWEDHLEEGIATHASILACRIPRTEEPGRLQGHKEIDMTEAA